MYSSCNTHFTVQLLTTDVKHNVKSYQQLCIAHEAAISSVYAAVSHLTTTQQTDKKHSTRNVCLSLLMRQDMTRMR